MHTSLTYRNEVDLRLGGRMSRSALLPSASGPVFSTSVSEAYSPSGIGPVATILVGTLNGERFLPEQLASLERQTFRDCRLIASDDGASDRTKCILHAFQKSFEPGKVEIIAGPRRGAPQTFFSWPAPARLRPRMTAKNQQISTCSAGRAIGRFWGASRCSFRPVCVYRPCWATLVSLLQSC
jgi:hypothetical protein